MSTSKFFGVSPVDDHRPIPHEPVRFINRERLWRGSLVEELPLAAIEISVEGEVVGRRCLTFGDQVEERFLAVGKQRVVRRSLDPDSRPGVGRKVLATGRASSVRWVDASAVGKSEQLFVETVVQARCQIFTGVANRRKQIRPTDIADEKRVTSEYCVGRFARRVVPHHDADRLRRVARGVANLKDDLSKVDSLTISKLS